MTAYQDNKSIIKREQGVSIIEFIIAMVLFVLVMGAVSYLIIDTFMSVRLSKDRTEALAFVEEGMEALRSIRDNDFMDIYSNDDGTPRGIDNSGGIWKIVSAPQLISGKYTRSVKIGKVLRDIYGNIVEAGGNDDPATKKITSSVSWNLAPLQNSVVEASSYLSNWIGFMFLDTTENDFNRGQFNQTEAIPAIPPPAGNGSVKLQNQNQWLSPKFDGYFNTDDKYNAVDVQVKGVYAYLVTRNNSSAPPNHEFYIIDVSDSSNPQLAGSAEIGYRTVALHVAGNYAFVATNDSSNDLFVLDIRDVNNPVVVRNYNIPTGSALKDVFADDNYVYAVMGSTAKRLYILSVSDLVSGSDPIVSSLNLNANPNSIYVYDNNNGLFAFIATSNNNKELIAVDVTDPNNPVEEDAYNAPGRANGIDVFVANNLAYLARAKSNKHEIFRFDISGLISGLPDSGMVFKDSINYGYNIRKLKVNSSYLFIVNTRSNSNNFEIFNSQSLSPISSTNVASSVYGLDINGSYAYFATSDNNMELQIYNDGGIPYANGTFESQTFDSGSASAQYQFVYWFSDNPTGTSIQLETRTADSEAGLLSANWTGPYSSGDIIRIDPDATGTRWIQYKAALNSNGSESPIIGEVGIYYKK